MKNLFEYNFIVVRDDDKKIVGQFNNDIDAIRHAKRLALKKKHCRVVRLLTDTIFII